MGGGGADLSEILPSPPKKRKKKEYLECKAFLSYHFVTFKYICLILNKEPNKTLESIDHEIYIYWLNQGTHGTLWLMDPWVKTLSTCTCWPQGR